TPAPSTTPTDPLHAPTPTPTPTPEPDYGLCGPENEAATEAPSAAVHVSQRMPLSWRLCYMWRALERHDYHPYRFDDIRRAFLSGHPVDAKSRAAAGPSESSTEVTIARIAAVSGQYEQRV